MVNPISFPSPQAYSGGADFSQLANLGNVYKQAQEDAAKQAALAQLGSNADANALALLHSGVPSLAQIGLNMQQQGVARQREDARYAVTDRRADEQLGFQRADARRKQEDWEKADADEAAAAKLIGGMVPGQPRQPPAQPPAGNVFATGAPPIAAAQPLGVPPPVDQPPVAQSPIAPSQLQATGAMTPQPVARAASNLASNEPAAAAGISREQIGEMYRNPLTRPLATALLQKMYDPGTYTFQQVGDKLVRTNSKTGVSDIVMRDTKPTTLGEDQRLIGHDADGNPIDVTPGGDRGSKQQREVAGYYQAGKDLNMSDDEARAFAANKGKTPKSDLSPTEEKMVMEQTKQIHAGEDVIDNIKRLQELSKTAYSGVGASTRAKALGAILPDNWIPQGATDTTELENTALQNVARQAKETFGSRLAVAEVKLLGEIETNPLQSDAARQRIYTRLDSMFKRHLADMTSEREQIRNKTFFKPGGGAAPAAGGGRPSLGDIFGGQ